MQPETSLVVKGAPSLDELRAAFPPMVVEATALVVSDVASHGAALEALKTTRERKRLILEKINPIIDAAFKTHRGLTNLRAEAIKPFDDAEAIYNRKASAFEREQEAIAARERERIEQQARKEEEERILRDAVAADEAGDPDLAEALLDETPTVPVLHVTPAVARVEGVTTRETWRAEVADKLALIRYVAAHPEWVNLLDANMPALNGLARSARKGMAIPGVRAVSETSRAVRA